MANIIDMPKLSDTMTVGTLVRWLKKEGDAVKSGDMLAEIETDKATMELESFFDGTLLRIFAQAGAQVAIGAALCAIGEKGEKVDAPSPAAKPQDEPRRSPAERDEGGPKAGEKKPEQNKVENPAPGKDGGPSSGEAAQSAVAGVAASASASAADPGPPAAAGLAEAGPGSATPATTTTRRIKISPLARKVAAQQNLDPARIAGTGPGGRIVKADVLAAASDPTRLKSPSAPGSKLPAPSFAGGTPAKTGPIQEARTVPASNMRATIARRLLEAKTTIPHFYLEIEVDAEPLLAIRAQLNSGFEKEGVKPWSPSAPPQAGKLSVNDFILKASAEALRRVPGVNASWTGGPSAGSGQAGIQYHPAAHVSFAVAMDDGLITPVIRDAHAKSVFQISAEARPLGRRAKEKKLKPDEFTGGTFCVSNLGMMGIERFSAIINPPNAAILAVGTTVAKPVVRNGVIAPGQTMVLTLSCDHRVVDGALGAQFLAALKDLLEKPALLLV